MAVINPPVTLEKVRDAVVHEVGATGTMPFEQLWLQLLPGIETARDADFWRLAIDRLAADGTHFTIDEDDQVRVS
jgi:hypothetical protein